MLLFRILGRHGASAMGLLCGEGYMEMESWKGRLNSRPVYDLKAPPPLNFRNMTFDSVYFGAFR